MSSTEMHPRTFAIISMLALAGPSAFAQGVVGGRLTESRTARPLACWEVELQAAEDRPLARTFTRWDGTFEFAAPPAGPHRFRFSAFGLQSVAAEFESSGPTMDLERDFSAALILKDHQTLPLVIEGAPPPIRGRGVPQYPSDLRLQGIEGDVFAAFAIDSTGRINAASAFVWGATARGFEVATRRALPSMRFDYSAHKGRAPCAFVGTPYLFRLSPP